MNYYNEFDPGAAAWLRELIKAGHIAPGDVDERSIVDVRADDLRGYTQCHFFAGIGGWPLALRQAGWPDDKPVWTGSCPCQPFSSAGAGAGFSDERHLWPHFQRLIAQRSPSVCFGEQVAAKAADDWIDLVQVDMENMGYAFAAIAYPAASCGAPHIRDRTYWVGHSDKIGRQQLTDGHRGNGEGVESTGRQPVEPGQTSGLSDGLEHPGQHDDSSKSQAPGNWQPEADRSSNIPCRPGVPFSGVANSEMRGDSRGPGEVSSETERPLGVDLHESGQPGSVSGRPGPVNGPWGNADWLWCRDNKWRPVEPGTSPLAYGLPRSMGALSPRLQGLASVAGLDGDSLKRAKQFRIAQLRGYGNAINLEQARVFIESFMETVEGVNHGSDENAS